MNKLEQAARQALGALEALNPYPASKENQRFEAITALREALAKQAEQEPVAWMFEFPDKRMSPQFDVCPHGGKWKPLYAAPVRTKDLTDDEIWKELVEIQASSLKRSWLTFARAVIAADRENNK